MALALLALLHAVAIGPGPAGPLPDGRTSSAPSEAGGQQGGECADRHRDRETAPAVIVVRAADQDQERADHAGGADEKLADLPLLPAETTRGDVKSLVTLLLSVAGTLFAIHSIWISNRTFRHARLQARGRVVVAGGRVRRDGSARVCGVDLLLKNVGGMHLDDLSIAISMSGGDGADVFERMRLEELDVGETAFVRLSAVRPCAWAVPIAGPLAVKVVSADHLGTRFAQERNLKARLRNGGERLSPIGPRLG